MKKIKQKITTILFVLILIIGIGIMSYPFVSDWWNSFHQTRAIQDYTKIVEQMDENEYEEYFKQAEEYNKKLQQMTAPFQQFDEVRDEYFRTFDATGTGIIGYVTIPCIDVELPIYHGTADDVLNIAVGHLEGSTFPIGGESTHAVLSAHRGLPTSKLFTNLDRVSEGDIFVVTVLNRILTYRVDQILIVDPDKMEALNIIRGEDHCTLVTCTPYGINTHRMLVRGVRIDNIEGPVSTRKEAFRIPYTKVILTVIAPLFVIMFILLMILKPKRHREYDITELHECIKSETEKRGEMKK